ncbi:hypothetical protein LQW54_002542 [Pestalotiopsis sp. IQ-011]
MIRQVPINNTIQVNVGPGNQTGLYYILLSNLPWQTSWKQMKDHVRTVCSAVERVEIFNESTSGWTCRRCREASGDSNITSHSKDSTANDAVSGDHATIDVAGSIEPRSDYRDNNYWYQSYDSNYVENPPMMIGQIPAYQAELSYQYSQPSEPYNNHYSTMPEIPQAPVQAHMQSPPAVIETEYRKIIIKNLSRWAQSDQIKSLLRSRCGFGGGEVNSIKIPRSREGGHRRHAMITFEKGEHAARAVQRLHDFRFEGHQLDVKITNEGVSQSEERKPKRQPAENPSPCASVLEKKEKPIKKGVVVANGSSIRPTSQSSEARSKR